MEIPDSIMNEMFEELTKIKEKLIDVNNKSGATQRAENMRKEIKELGWWDVCNRHHPLNTDEPGAKEIFAMYEYIYETMKKKGEIE